MSALHESAPSQKRKRTDDPTNTVSASTSGTNAYIRRSSKIWMPYGDIVLQAEGVQFRVNRDILARNSVAFEGMFALPRPQSSGDGNGIHGGDEVVEGCPVVPLTDKARDVELLLAGFYDPFHLKTKPRFDELAASLRLGRKYEAVTFKNDAASRIHAEFPTTLENWDRRATRTRTAGLEFIRPAAGIFVDLVNLAYENGVYRSIPALAFKCLSTYTLAQLFAGIEREDGSRTVLSDAMKSMFALALEAIQLFQRNNYQWLREEGEVVPDQQECMQDQLCDDYRREMCRFECAEERVDVTYMLEAWEKVADGAWVGRLCTECERAAKAEFEAGRQRAWDRLPVFFGLPEWKDLKDMD
ncbi:hypothetical protein C8F04DRAFT_1035459 [Mycena alexandri]|uniref:BTB domain-containing protein n=1 Tax=Mycena alexandri TaxID=1745969 RepID=A0AAD6T1V7_9AGAR|nr:hypothetical protein C8F04DRAFT_1035459 [Mycena alexandri]